MRVVINDKKRWGDVRKIVSTLAVAVVVVISAGAVLTQGSAVGSPPVPASPESDKNSSLQAQIKELRESLESSSEDFVKAAAVLKQTQAEHQKAQTTLAAAQKELQQATLRDQELAQQLSFAQGEFTKTTNAWQQRKTEHESVQGEVGRIVNDTYMNKRISGLTVLLGASDAQEYNRDMVAVETVVGLRTSTMRQLETQQAQLKNESDRLSALTDRIQSLKTESQPAVQQKNAATTKASQAETDVKQKVTQQQQAVNTLNSKIAEEKKRLATLQKEQEQVQALMAQRSRAASKSRKSSGVSSQRQDSGGTLATPVAGPITSEYGYRLHPILKYRRLHSGMDYGSSCGTPVYAATSGVVVLSGYTGGYGNRVVIDHGYIRGVDLGTAYNHLSRSHVRSGQRVSRGQLVGSVGSTGLSTGCHLHFEVLANGGYVNPRNWL